MWHTVSGLLTGVLLLLFIGIIIWAWHPRRKKEFDQMANLPLNHQQENRNHE